MTFVGGFAAVTRVGIRSGQKRDGKLKVGWMSSSILTYDSLSTARSCRGLNALRASPMVREADESSMGHWTSGRPGSGRFYDEHRQ
jgi:hypothetical protein